MLMRFFIFILLISQSVFALDFKPGTGSQFVMSTEGQKVDLSIYITERNSDKISVEMHFGAGGIMLTNMWQQFQFKLENNLPLVVEAGYIKTKPDKKPEIMTDDFFKQNENGVQMQDFLFSKKAEIEKYYLGDETVELPAGTIVAKHYQKKRGDQVVDFWISSQVGPISLVKLISKSEVNKHNNYTIELASLLRNVKASINPAQAIPLTKDTAEILKKSSK